MKALQSVRSRKLETVCQHPHSNSRLTHEIAKAYISYPENKSTTNAILLLTDVYGFTFPNTRLIADQFALHGYLTVIPDLFNGREVPFPPPADFSLQKYIDETMPRVESVDPIIENVIAELRDAYGVRELGGVGYCFGGKYVCRFLHPSSSSPALLDAGFVAHPSFTTSAEISSISGPLSIAAAETDEIFTRVLRHQTEEILAEKDVEWQICVYGGTEHGFAVKGHMSTKKARFAKEQTFGQAVGWFEEYLRGGEEE
jgi:dienelactone hydrolase